MKPETTTVTLPPRDYQPNKSELSEDIRVQVPGDDVQEKMDNFASAVMRPAKIQYRKK